MNFDNIKVQQDPTNKDIKFILELFNLNKLIEAKDQINKLIIKFPHSSILFNIMGAVLAGQLIQVMLRLIIIWVLHIKN